MLLPPPLVPSHKVPERWEQSPSPANPSLPLSALGYPLGQKGAQWWLRDWPELFCLGPSSGDQATHTLLCGPYKIQLDKSVFVFQMLLKIIKLHCLKSTSFLESLSYLLDILLRLHVFSNLNVLLTSDSFIFKSRGDE
ncbi:hypothetical protein L345_05053, partial [Ophiophagus hannah]